MQGSDKAMELFKKFYDQYDFFSNTGCHMHAHHVGDLGYFYEYKLYNDVTKMDFSQNITACGHGFLHGFFEHLFQENPDPDFVDQTCKQLTAKYANTLPSMQFMCYHGSGHGFMIAQVDSYRQTENTAESLSAKPLEKCKKLDTTEFYQKECKSGLFNVLTTFAENNELGLRLDYNENMYEFCHGVLDFDDRGVCFEEVTRRLHGTYKDKYEYIKKYVPPEWFGKTFWIAMKSLIAYDPRDKHKDMFEWCRTLPEDAKSLCQKAIPHGLMQHGSPLEEHKIAIDFCDSDFLDVAEKQDCYNTVLVRLNRDFQNIDIKKSCRDQSTSINFCNFYNEATRDN
jgi:hypothetical protein